MCNHRVGSRARLAVGETGLQLVIRHPPERRRVMAHSITVRRSNTT
jgi:hypothetical protein